LRAAGFWRPHRSVLEDALRKHLAKQFQYTAVRHFLLDPFHQDVVIDRVEVAFQTDIAGELASQEL
jgi:hypothetical protein